MKRTPIRSLFACLSLIFVAGAADAQQHENYCNSKTLLQSAKDGFAQAQNLKMAGASVCNVESDTRSYGCMWTFDKSPLAAAGYQKAVLVPGSRASPKSNRGARGVRSTPNTISAKASH